MKVPLFAPAVALLVVGSILGQTARRPPLPVRVSTRVQLVAVVDPPRAQQGHSILLKPRLKNVSSKVVTIGEGSLYTEYELTVTDTSGREPAKTDFGRSVAEEATLLHATKRDMQPGDVADAALEITKIYEVPGTYYARATRVMWAETLEDNDAFTEKVFSNPVEFTIVP